jgi:hypothetical protein
VQVFSADLKCESGSISNEKYFPARGDRDYNTAMDISTPSCNMSIAASNTTSEIHFSPHINREWWGYSFTSNCSNLVAQDAKRLVVFFGRVPQDSENFTDQSVVICQPTYALNNGFATVDALGNIKSVQNVNQTGSISNISGGGILDAVLASLRQTSVFSYVQVDQLQNATLSPFMLYFHLVNPRTTIDAFQNTTFLADAARDVYSALAVQIAKRYLTIDAQASIPGTTTYVEQRLFVRLLSIDLMDVVLVLLLVMTAVLFLFGPRNVVPRDPSSIGGLCAILYQSQRASKLLANTGASSAAILRSVLSGNYHTKRSVTEHGRLAFVLEADDSIMKQEVESKKFKFWRPWIISNIGFILLFVLPLTLVIALEMLFQRSEKQNGLSDAKYTGYAQYAWTYVPAMIMVLIQSLCSDANFKLRVFDPYRQLRRGTTNVDRSIMDRSLSKFSFHAIASALKRNCFALAATSFAVLLTSGLTSR